MALAIFLCSVELIISATGIREQVRSEFGLPSDNVLAIFVYGFLHEDFRHLVDNVGWLLVCGSLVEQKIGRGWFLILTVVSVPIGGYLFILTAPVFIVTRREDALHSIGFSIVSNALFVFCIYSVILCLWEGTRFRQLPGIVRKWLGQFQPQLNPLKWSAKVNQVIILGVFLYVLFTGIDDGSPESILGHSIGLILGLVAAICFLVRRVIPMRPPEND